MGSASLQHTRARRSTCYRLYGPATFRPQGLVTLTATYSLRALAGFFSRRRRSWDSPFGAFSSRKVSTAFPRRRAHMPFAPTGFPVPTDRAGPAQWAAASGLQPFRESLATAAGLVQRPLDAPLGFALLGLSGDSLPGISPGLLPRASRPSASRPTTTGASESRSALAWPHPSARVNGRGGRGSPFRVPAPVRSWTFKRARAWAILFTSCRCVHYCRSRQSWGATTRSSGDVRGSPSVPLKSYS
jgi:hypothetical protein